MLTKTGLRPRESRRNGDGSAGLPSIQKLPPIVAATAASRDPHSNDICLLYTSPSPRDKRQSRMPSSA